MSDELKLLPCPFCGGTDLVYRQDEAEDEPGHFYAWHVFCRDCHAHGRNNFPIGWCESHKAAAEAWNLRGFKRYGDFYAALDATPSKPSEAGESSNTTTQDEWRPIETWSGADGESALVYAGKIELATWDDGEWWVLVEYSVHPTHWMLLPIAPAVGSEL